MKNIINYSVMSAIIIISLWVFSLQRSEITALHIQIDTLKAKSERLLNQKIVYDTISTYVFKGFIVE